MSKTLMQMLKEDNKPTSGWSLDEMQKELDKMDYKRVKEIDRSTKKALAEEQDVQKLMITVTGSTTNDSVYSQGISFQQPIYGIKGEYGAEGNIGKEVEVKQKTRRIDSEDGCTVDIDGLADALMGREIRKCGLKLSDEERLVLYDTFYDIIYSFKVIEEKSSNSW